MRRVALLIETSTSWGKGLIEGVGRFARGPERWSLLVEPRGLHESLALPFGWRGDGVIARLTSTWLAEEVRRAGVPCVNVSMSMVADSPAATVTVDELRVGQLAAEHLLTLGLTSFAYVGPPHRPHHRDRMIEAFTAKLGEHGFAPTAFQPDRNVATGQVSHDHFVPLTRWLAGLPRPCGLLAWYTAGARQVTDACRYLNIEVPGEIAVLSGDHDQFMAELSDPPLSCIDHDAVRVGYEAAVTLSRLMNGEPVTAEPTLLPPGGVIERASTRTLAVPDALVASALRFIRENAHRPLRVRDVLTIVPLSRRALEMRFRQALGRSPGDEIRRAKLDRACDLLTGTVLPIGEVARRCGFFHCEVMQRSFRQRFGVTPSEYRRRHALGEQPEGAGG